jgi:hypothetical protein
MAKFLQVSVLLALGFIAVSAQSNCPAVVPRGGWNARDIRNVPVLPIRPAPFVIVHPTGTNSCSTQAECSEIIRNIQDFQTQANGWSDISYHFLIGGDNRIYAGRGWGRMGENVEGFSNQAINIGYIGRFNDAAPNAEAAALLDQLVNCGIAERALATNVRVIAQCQAARFVTCEATRIFSWISEHPRFVATPRPV